MAVFYLAPPAEITRADMQRVRTWLLNPKANKIWHASIIQKVGVIMARARTESR